MRTAGSAIALLLLAASGATGQVGASIGEEHWVLTMRTPGDSGTRALRIRWSGDSLIGTGGDGVQLIGVASGGSLTVELRYGGGGMTRLTGTREAPGRMSGDWRGRGIRANAGNAGTWSAVRSVGAERDPARYEQWILTRIPAVEQVAGGAEVRSFHVDAEWRGDSLIAFPFGFAPMVGEARGGQFTALWPDTDTRMLVLRGTRITRDSLTGTWTSYTPPARSGTWVARRATGRAAPRSYEFTPANWYTAYSAANPPGLRVFPGDTIRMRGSSPSAGIVPAPIAVTGALPGDLLAVRIIRIRPAETAYSQRSLVLDWFTTPFARNARPPAGNLWNWRIDTIAGIARLDTTMGRGPALERLKDVIIPLAPMIGNIGVAPALRQAFLSPDEGDYGGNLDYKWLREGMTLYLPVFHPDALLSISDDHHAAQGDGELAGTGLEVSADVDVVVNVIRGASVEHIRAEDATHRYAFGVSADLAQALRRANTALAEWLAQDYRLNQQELAFLLGAAAELDIANVWGSQTTVVAKIRKSLLEQIKP